MRRTERSCTVVSATSAKREASRDPATTALRSHVGGFFEERGCVFEVDGKKLRNELAEARGRLAGGYFGSWVNLEPVARCMHWLGDPDAALFFRKAAASREPVAHRAADLLAIGNYLRLAEDSEERSREFIERAYAELAKNIHHVAAGYPGLAELLDCAFLLGKLEEAEEVDERKGAGSPVAKLARAHRNTDAALAGDAAQDILDFIRSQRVKISNTGSNLHWWDRYELSLRTKAELEGRMDDAALPAPDLLRREQEVGQPTRRREIPARKRLTRDQVANICFEEDEEPDLHSTDLSGLDLSGLDLSGATLTGADLRGADLSETTLVETNFTGADMRGVKLAGITPQETVFAEADLSGTDLSGVGLAGSDFSKANLRGADLRNANLPHTDFTGADLTNADLRGANLDGADLEGAKMDDVLR